MRRWNGLIALGLILAVSVPAMGDFVLSAGPHKGKFESLGSFFRAGVPLPNPGGAFVPLNVGDELRNIANITTMSKDFVGAAPEFTGDPGVEQLTGLVWDLEPLQSYGVPGLTQIELGDPTKRNPVQGAPALTGGVLRIYQDVGAVSPFTDLGPGAWMPGATPATEAYPSVNTSGESCWLEAVFIPFPGATLNHAGQALLVETVSIGASERGVGAAYLMVTGGSFAPFVTAGSQNTTYIAEGGYMGGGGLPAGITADVRLDFDLYPNASGAPPWGVVIEDPFRFSVIPEPATLSLLAFGALTLLRRRRK